MASEDDRVLALFPELVRPPQTASTGVLPCQEIRALIRDGCIVATEPIADDQIQPASLDLRLGAVAYRLQASFLPGLRSTVESKMDALSMASLDLSSPTVLEKGCVYLVPLMESLHLPDSLEARANPKSTTGRLDLFTRLVADYGREFERIPAGYSGPLFAEIVPRTFSVIVEPGARLSQLRFLDSESLLSDWSLRRVDKREGLHAHDVRADIKDGIKLSVNLRSSDESNIVAYRGKKNAPLIELNKIDHYEPREFWDEIRSPQDGCLILNPGDFYILGSCEPVKIMPNFAGEMVPYDPSVGEFRIHYAGFFDPGFGYDERTQAVLEVRAHEVPFVIEHGQVVGRLVYSQLRDIPDKVYGASIGSSYQRQGLALSKQFRRAGDRCREIGVAQEARLGT